MITCLQMTSLDQTARGTGVVGRGGDGRGEGSGEARGGEEMGEERGGVR